METLYLSEYVAGTAPLVGTIAEEMRFSEHASGIVTDLGISAEAISFSEHLAGVLSIFGHAVETISFTESLTGTVTIKGVSSERMRVFKESLRSEMYGISVETLPRFSEFVTGIAPILSGTLSESLRFSEHAYALVIVPESDEIWVVNLTTGGHSRYLGAIDGSEAVSAYALTGINQLGADKRKYVPFARVHMRATGNMEISTVTDEVIDGGPYLIETDNIPGIHKRRVQLADGICGMDWQFEVANVNGCDVTLKELDVEVMQTTRIE